VSGLLIVEGRTSSSGTRSETDRLNKSHLFNGCAIKWVKAI
jgi:hypothetical protein